MAVCSGNDGLPPIRLYDYQPSRGGYRAEEFLKGFSGDLTCDGVRGYNKLKKPSAAAALRLWGGTGMTRCQGKQRWLRKRSLRRSGLITATSCLS